MRKGPHRSAAISVLAVCLVVALAGCAPTENAGLEIDPQTSTCFVDPGLGSAVLQIPVLADPTLQFTPDILRVGFDDAEGIALAGIGLVFDETPYDVDTGIPVDELAEMTAARDDQMLHLPVPRVGSATLVLLLEIESGSSVGTLDSLRVFWGGGEPIYWQTVDIAARVDADCVLTT